MRDAISIILFVFASLNSALTYTWTVTKESTAETALAQEVSVDLTVPPEATGSPVAAPKEVCSCVQYVRTKIPDLPRGDAYSLIPNSPYPIKGGVIKLSYQKNNQFDPLKYHLAYVEKVTAEGIYVSEKCFQGKGYNERLIAFSDEAIRGYWRPAE